MTRTIYEPLCSNLSPVRVVSGNDALVSAAFPVHRNHTRLQVPLWGLLFCGGTRSHGHPQCMRRNRVCVLSVPNIQARGVMPKVDRKKRPPPIVGIKENSLSSGWVGAWARARCAVRSPSFSSLYLAPPICLVGGHCSHIARKS